jgi:hypothetical protein
MQQLSVCSRPLQHIIYSAYSFVQCPMIGPPLWSIGQSSWLQIKRSGFDSRSYHIFSKVVGLERGPLSLVSTTVELHEGKSSGSGLEHENTAVEIRHADHVAPSIRKRWHLLCRQAAFARSV